jgi:hypothetical protein
VYFTGNPPQDLGYHSYKAANPQYPPSQPYTVIEPVPANYYNPYGL